MDDHGGWMIIWLVVDLPLWKMMEFVNGKDDIPYTMENKIPWFQSTKCGDYIPNIWVMLKKGHLPTPVHHYAYIASIVMAMKSGDKYITDL